ncbi:ATP-binding cassette domain-containing protein [bacterium]|nr:ATP-binding cassette domain-containing protein [bacterium]
MLDNSIILYKEFTNEFTAVQKLRDTFDEIPPMKNKNSDILFHYKKGEICIKNLGFSYNKGNPVFDDFSLTIEGGKKTAFVGLSGSGKSTLIKLIA